MLALLGRSADPNAADRQLNTPLHVACHLSGISLGRFANVVLALLENGADPSLLNAAGQSPLHLYAGSPAATPTMVQAMVRHGVDVNRRDRLGYTPLQFATRVQNREASTAACRARSDAITLTQTLANRKASAAAWHMRAPTTRVLRRSPPHPCVHTRGALLRA